MRRSGPVRGEGARKGPRLLLVEFRSKDPFSQYRSETFPFLLGAARARNVPARWVCFGFDPAAQLDARLSLALPRGDVVRLEAVLETWKPTHVVFNEHLDRRGERRLARRFPHLVLRHAEFGDTLLTEKQFLAWLALPAGRAADGLLLDRARPEYDWESVNPQAESIEKPIQVLCGPSCLHARRVAEVPAFRGLDLAPAEGRVYGCSFCGRDRQGLRYPFRTEPLALALRQIEAARRAASGRRRAARYAIDGARILAQIDTFLEKVLAAKHPPSEFYFACRADDLLRHAAKVERKLPALAEAGHSIHFANMGVENFSPIENERFNKHITREHVRRVLELFERWEDRWPGTVVFDRHGGFGFILFTPWTTLDDLACNARALRELRLANVGFCLTTRLLLLPGRPITLLAEADGLTTGAFEDPIMARFCRAGCLTEWNQQEIPWRFRNRIVGLIHAILMRRVPEAIAGLDEPDVDRVAATVRALPASQRDWLPFFDLLLECARRHPNIATVREFLRLLRREAARVGQDDGNRTVRSGNGSGNGLRNRVARVLGFLARDPRRPLRGFECRAVVSEGDRVRVEVGRRGDRLVFWVAPRRGAHEAFLRTPHFVLYHAQETPPDTADKVHVLSVFARMLDLSERNRTAPPEPDSGLARRRIRSSVRDTRV